MKAKLIIIFLIITLILTSSTLFIKVIPCKSWYGSNIGIDDLAPHNTFCNIFYGVGPYNEYYYLTSNPTIAFLLTFAILFIIILLISFLIKKRDQIK